MHEDPRYKSYLVCLLISILILGSVFSSTVVLSQDMEDEKEILLVYKDGDRIRTLREDDKISILAEYDSFLLVETSKERTQDLEYEGYSIRSLENKDYVGLSSYSFNSREGPPEISENLRIDGYESGETGHYIIQFIGPIKSEWKGELKEMGVSFHEFRHRFNYIVSMNSDIEQEVEEFDFIDWVGIYQPAYRFDKGLLERSGSISLEVKFFNGLGDEERLKKRLSALGTEVETILANRMVVETEAGNIQRLANQKNVLSITENTAQYEIFNADSTWIGQTNQPDYRKVNEEGVTGKGELITVMDSELYMEDDYYGDGVHEMWEDPDGNEIGDDHRKVQAWYVPGDSNAKLEYGTYHGTHVTGTVLGNSPIYDEHTDNDGNALDARIVFQDIDNEAWGLNLPSDMYNMGWGDSYDQHSRTHTNSWGGGDGYGGLGQEADLFLWDHQDFNILFALGNSGPDPNTLSQQSEGKNVISVGSLTNYPEQGSVSSFSSRGYADDGRIKPTLMHVGEGVTSADRSYDGYQTMSGTSMSTPGIAGQVGQIRQYYLEGWHVDGTPNTAEGFNPSNALVRATLINGAVEISGDGAYENDARFPNNDQGHGRTKLDRVLHFEGDERKIDVFDSWDEGVALDTGETWETEFEVDDPTQELEITLAWTDYPGSDGSDEDDPAIVNDLDLEVEAPDGTRYVGNAFTGHDPGYSEPDPTSNPWSGQRDGEFDGLNVEENVLMLPDENGVEEGTYEVTVTGHNVPEESQPFALVASGGLAEEEPEPGPLAPTDPDPEDGATGVATDVELSVYAEHEDGDRMDVSFYDASDDSLIGEDNNVQSGTRAETDWTGLDEGTEYDWYAVADDGDQTATSSTWRFMTESEEYELTIDAEEGGTTDPEPGTYTYEEGEVVTVEAISDEGYHFLEWTGDYPEGEQEEEVIDIEMDENKEVTAHFEEDEEEYTLTIDSTAGGEVIEPGEGEFTYDAGEEVNLEAVADEDYTFVEWTGDIENIEDPTASDTTITMEGDYAITANFDETQVDEVEITPSEDQELVAGERLIFDAAAYDEEGELITDDRMDFEWESATRGVFNRRRAGDYDVTATYDDVTSLETTVTVEAGEADSIEISPEDETAEAGSTVAYTTIAYDEYENEIGDVSEDTTWSIEDGAGGSWDGNEYTTEVVGDWTVTGDYDDLTDNTLLAVEPGAVDTVELTPSEDQTIVSGEKLEFSAEAYDAQGNLIADNVEAFDWQNALRGVFYYETPGEYEVTATYDGVESEVTTVTVEEDDTDGTEVNVEGEKYGLEYDVEVEESDELKLVAERNFNTKPLSLYSIF